jgi:hypothetical protein
VCYKRREDEGGGKEEKGELAREGREMTIE